jgi:histidine triad (HIT) family protein
MPCLFCEILAGTRPATFVFRDDHCAAFLDIFPVRTGHVLVIPTWHAALLEELPDNIRGRLFKVGQRILLAQKRAGLAEAVNLLVNDGKAANQHIPHVHMHLVPRKSGDIPGTMLQFVSRGFNLFGAARQHELLEATAADIRKYLS